MTRTTSTGHHHEHAMAWWHRRRSTCRDAGQAMIAFVLGITVIVSTGAAILATNVIQHDPLVQSDAVDHYAYRAVEAGLNSFLSEVNANPNEMNCNSLSKNIGECPSGRYRTWSPVTGTTGGNGIEPEYYFWTNPKFCYTTTCKKTSSTYGPLEYVKETVYGAAGYPGHLVYSRITGNFEAENGFLTHIWWSDYEVSDPLLNGRDTAACTWDWDNTYDGPNVPVPAATGISPTSGSTAGGTTVTITGTGFVGTATVTFGGVAGTTVYVVSRNKITVRTPAHTAGPVTVLVTTTNGSSSPGLRYDYETTTPRVTKVTPTDGTTSGGTAVTLTGSGFLSGATVKFGNSPATTVIVVSGTEITAVAPAHAAGAVTVIVTTRTTGGTKPRTSNAGEHFTYYAPPTLTKAAPSVGKTAGGTTITLTGTNFVSNQTTVSFGGTAGTTVKVTTRTTTTLTVKAPAHTAGQVPVTVTTPGGTSNGETYTYDVAPALATVAPAAGKTTGGTTVTLTGTGFTSTATVSFGGTAGKTVHVTSTTTITVKTPAHATTGSVTVTVTTPGGTTGGVGFYFGAPTLTKLTPSAERTGTASTKAVLTGTGFVSGATVTFGGTTIPTTAVTVNSATSISVTVPAHASPGEVRVSVKTNGGTSTTLPFYYGAPTLAGITPPAGKTAGGTTVTLTGSGFVTGATVTFGGTTIPAADVTVASTRSIVVTTPKATTTGPVTVTVTTGAGTSGGQTYTYDAAPTLTKLTPAAGKTAGGTTITLTGTNFVSGTTKVMFGTSAGTTVKVTSAHSTLTVKAPAHAAGAVTVTVATPGGTSGGKTYTYDAAPTLTKLSKSTGPTAGGTTITLTGTNFVSGTTKVTFTTVPETPITVDGTTTLTVKVPAHAAGAVTVTVTTPGGTSGGKTYTYDAAPTLTKLTPPAGKTAGGTTITLTGTNFVSGTTKVTFGTSAGTTVTVTGTTSLTVKAPKHAAGSVTVTVTTPGGTTGGKAYTYDAAPTLTKLTPPAGKTAGGTTITLAGTNFVSGTTTVTFGTSAGTTVAVTGTTSLTVKAPKHAAGSVTVTVTTPGGTTGGKTYTYDAVPTLSKLSKSTGSTRGGTRITLTGTNFVSGTTTVTFGTSAGTTVAVIGTTSLTVKAPKHAAGSVTVTVTTPGGTSNGEPFTYKVQNGPDVPVGTRLDAAVARSGGGSNAPGGGRGPIGTLDAEIRLLPSTPAMKLTASTGKACTVVVFGPDTQVYGPIFSNDSIYVNTSHTPGYLGPISTADPKCVAVYGGTYTTTPPTHGTCIPSATAKTDASDKDDQAFEQVPQSDTELSTYAAQDNAAGYGCLYDGPTTIELDAGDEMTVWSPDTPSTAHCPSTGTTGRVPNGEHTTAGNGVIYVQTETSTADCKSGANPFEDKATGGNGKKAQTAGDYDHDSGTTPNCEADAFVSDHPATSSTASGKPTTIPGVSGQLTIGSEANIVVTGTIEYTHCGSKFDSAKADTEADACPFHQSGGTKTPTHSTRTEPNDVLGLIANDYIEVSHPITTTSRTPISTCGSSTRGTPLAAVCEPGAVTVDAAILALQHSFAVNNAGTTKHGSGTGEIGTLTVYGTIDQKWRGAVGTITTRTGNTLSGYLKYYDWDSRISAVTPPHYLSPSTPSWGLGASAIEGVSQTAPACIPATQPATYTTTPTATPPKCG